MVSPDGATPSRMVGVSASVNLPLHHKVQKFSSGTSSPVWFRKKGCKMVVVWCCTVTEEKHLQQSECYERIGINMSQSANLYYQENKQSQYEFNKDKPLQIRKWLRLATNAPGASHKCTVFNCLVADTRAMAGNVPRTSWNLHHAWVHISARLVRCTHLDIKPPRCIACEKFQTKTTTTTSESNNNNDNDNSTTYKIQRINHYSSQHTWKL